MLDNKSKIINRTMTVFSQEGYEGVSMRRIAKDIGIRQSTIYNYFESKEDLLDGVFEYARTSLGEDRRNLKSRNTFKDELNDRIKFQFDNADKVTFILKYYYHYRNEYEKNEMGFVPVTAYKHIEEIMTKWQSDLSIDQKNILNESKIITHAINGFVMEYYPTNPSKSEQQKLVNSISGFVVRSVQN